MGRVELLTVSFNGNGVALLSEFPDNQTSLALTAFQSMV